MTGLCRLKNPVPYLARFPDADILTSSDNLVWRSSAFRTQCRATAHLLSAL